jgi:hypothetical protein
MREMNWRSALGEFALIILGVTAALAVDEWRQARNEQAVADQYVVRLAHALEKDGNDWRQIDQNLLEKMQTLDAALDWVRNPDLSLASIANFLQNLTDGSRMSYGLGSDHTGSIFREMVSTGRLGLIHDLEVREALNKYRTSVGLHQMRQAKRETNYAPTVYALIPRDPEFKVQEGLPSDQLISIARRAQELDLEGLIIAQRNRARLRREIAAELIDLASETLEVLN